MFLDGCAHLEEHCDFYVNQIGAEGRFRLLLHYLENRIDVITLDLSDALVRFPSIFRPYSDAVIRHTGKAKKFSNSGQKKSVFAVPRFTCVLHLQPVNNNIMTKEQYRTFRQAAMQGTMPDSQNPIFLFSTTDSALLTRIVNGELDAQELARIEMKNRGLSVIDGSYVGFAKAEELFNSIL